MRHQVAAGVFVTPSHPNLVTPKGECGHGLSHFVVHRRPSTNVEASQNNSGVTGLLRQARVQRLHRDKDVRGNVGRGGSAGVQTGLPIILLSAYSEMPERILWLVDDYVMKSEMPERLIPIIERAHRLRPHSDEPQRGRQQSAESVFGSTVLDVIQLSRRAMLKIWII